MTETPTHPELEQHGSFAHLKLGAKRSTVPPKLELARYLDLTALPAPPPKVVWGANVPAYPMYGNDTLGDCTAAAMGHMIQTWTSEAGKYREPALADVTGLYWRTGDGTDDGRQLTDITAAMEKPPGLGGDLIVGAAAVNLRSHAERDAAHWLFGGLYLAAALPLSAQTQKVWSVVNDPSMNQPGSWGYHCIQTVGRWPDGWQIVTWGARLNLTEAWFERYVIEAIAIVTQDWLDAQEESPIAGVNLALLEKDLAAL